MTKMTTKILAWETAPINAMLQWMMLAPVPIPRQIRRQPKQTHDPNQVTPFEPSSIICSAHVINEESKPSQQSSSWFSRWWNKEGPIKATLGEESSFVYDKELKRWVNKKVGVDYRCLVSL
jgi:hypothetical protein